MKASWVKHFNDDDDDDDDVQVVKNNLNPSWKKFTLSLQTFCSGDVDAPLKVHTHAHTHTLLFTSAGCYALLGQSQSSIRIHVINAYNSLFCLKYIADVKYKKGMQFNRMVCVPPAGKLLGLGQ